VLGLAPLPLLVFWLGRVWFTNKYKRRSPKDTDAYPLPN
jgi:hypothetical protein